MDRKELRACLLDLVDLIDDAESDDMLMCPRPNKNDAPQYVLDTYALVCEDHFRSSIIDPMKWRTRMRWSPSLTINNELQYYVDTQQPNLCPACPDPFSFDGENLTITASYAGANQAPATNGGQAGGQSYYSGVLSSVIDFQYGYVEWCARMPCDALGTWIGMWLYHRTSSETGAQNGKFSTEIDWEFVHGGGLSPNCALPAYHYDQACKIDLNGFTCNGQNAITQDCAGVVIDQNNGFDILCDDSFCEDFHTFGVLWESDRVVWYVDGNPVQTLCDADIVSQVPMYIITNFAVGGNFPQGQHNPAQYPAQMDIDYIRVYTNNIVPPL